MPLEEWLKLIFGSKSDSLFIDYEFPTDNHREEYLATISNRTDEEVKRLLLKFLVHTGTLETDRFTYQSLRELKESSPDSLNEIMKSQFLRRLVLFANKKSIVPPWEGITWILDLLPDSPKDALEGLSAYTKVHIILLPEGRLEGLFDSEAIIRAKYIGYPHTEAEKVRFFSEVTPREFEQLVERLYNKMGYETYLTSPQNDGGRDVIANIKTTAKKEHLRIECKRYNKPVGIAIARSLLGVVSDEKVNKGVLITTNRFTKGAKDFECRNPRLELISGDELVPLFNEHLGARWVLQINRIILESQRDNANQDKSRYVGRG